MKFDTSLLVKAKNYPTPFANVIGEIIEIEEKDGVVIIDKTKMKSAILEHQKKTQWTGDLWCLVDFKKNNEETLTNLKSYLHEGNNNYGSKTKYYFTTSDLMFVKSPQQKGKSLRIKNTTQSCAPQSTAKHFER